MLRHAADLIRAWGSVAVIGAGMSRERGYPLSAELLPLLWQSIDSDEGARADLAARLSLDIAPAKSLVGGDESRVREAYLLVASHDVCRLAFQHGFATLDARRRYASSPAHNALAEMNHRGMAESIVSLNWDTALEAAHERHYGRRLASGSEGFFKPHGDAADPTGRWVLPYEAATLPSALRDRMEALVAERPRVLLVAGYSEGDQDVVNELIQPLESRWQVVRVGPHAAGDLAIRLPADVALPMLLRAICPDDEAPGWDYVRFGSQRSISAALLGERLGERDVLACPRFPEVEEVVSRVRATGQVTLLGESGAGKSIIGYQAAHSLAQEGYEVLRLDRPGTHLDAILAPLFSIRRRTLLLVDDAQALPAALVRNIQDLANDRMPVIVITTKRPTGTLNVIELASEEQAKRLAIALRARAGEIASAIGALGADRKIDAADLERRFAAAEQTKRPWDFTFALRRGWDSAQNVVAVLAAEERSDLLLGLIAAGQLMSADSGVQQADLVAVAERLGRGPTWVRGNLKVLRQLRLANGSRRIRTPHAQFARVVLNLLLGSAADDRAAMGLVVAIKTMVTGEVMGSSLTGLSWLVSAMASACPQALDVETVRTILGRLSGLAEQPDRGQAASVLKGLFGLHLHEPTDDQAALALRTVGLLETDHGWLTLWIADAEASAAQGLGSLLGDLWRLDTSAKLGAILCEGIDPGPLLHRFASSPTRDIRDWRDLIWALCGISENRDSLQSSLNRGELLDLMARVAREDLDVAGDVASATRGIDPEFDLAMTERYLELVAKAINADPLGGYKGGGGFLMAWLNVWPGWGGPYTVGEMQVVRRTARTIRILPIVRSLSSFSRADIKVVTDLLNYLRSASPRKWRAVLGRLEPGPFSDSLSSFLKEPTPDPETLYELDYLFENLAAGSPRTRSLAVAKECVCRAAFLPPVLVWLAPSEAAERLREGATLAYQAQSQHLAFLAWALSAMASIDAELALSMIAAVGDDVRTAVSTAGPSEAFNDIGALALFLNVLGAVSSQALEELVRSLNAEAVVASWTKEAFQAWPGPVIGAQRDPEYKRGLASQRRRMYASYRSLVATLELGGETSVELARKLDACARRGQVSYRHQVHRLLRDDALAGPAPVRM